MACFVPVDMTDGATAHSSGTMSVSPLSGSGRNGGRGHTKQSQTRKAGERGTVRNLTGEERGCQAALFFFHAWLTTAVAGVTGCAVVGGLRGQFGLGSGLPEGDAAGCCVHLGSFRPAGRQLEQTFCTAPGGAGWELSWEGRVSLPRISVVRTPVQSQRCL